MENGNSTGNDTCRGSGHSVEWKMHRLLRGFDLVDEKGKIWTKTKFVGRFPEKAEKVINELYPLVLLSGNSLLDNKYRNTKLKHDLKSIIGFTVRRSDRRRRHKV